MFDGSERSSPRFLIAGQLTRDFALFPNGRARLDVPGGNLLYAAAGLAVWEPDPPPGLIARVGKDYPQPWLADFQRRGFDTRGIHILPDDVDLRYFYVYTDRTTRVYDNPIAHFARLGLPFPKVLFDYQAKTGQIDSRTRLSPIAPRQTDFLPEYLDATAVHLCPIDYLSHCLLPTIFRQAGFTTVTLDPSAGYMNPFLRDFVPSLITGLTAFLTSEDDLRSLFQGRTTDIWEMSDALASHGCEIIVIKRGARGQLLFDRSTHTRWEILPYPAQIVDVTGAGDAFCGGFLAGYRRTYDPLLAVLHGNISASFTCEGFDPLYAKDALAGLAAARLEVVRQSVRKV